MFTQEPMVYGLFRVSSLKEIGGTKGTYFFFVFCLFFLLIVNFYSLGPGEDINNPESEFGIFSPL